MTGREWDLRGGRLAGLRFTEWLTKNDGGDRALRPQYEDWRQAWHEAEAIGWVDTVRPKRKDACSTGYRPYPWPRPTAMGRLEVERVRGLRNNPQERAIACREAILLWLAHEGRGAVSCEVMVSRDDWRFYDTPFAIDEVNDAVDFLAELDFIGGVKSFGPGLSRPSLTARGRQCVEFFDADVRRFLNPAPSGGPITNNQQNYFYGGSSQASQGDHNTQTQKVSLHDQALAVIFSTMRDALSTVEDPDDRDDLAHSIHELELAVNGRDADMITARAGRLERLGARIGASAGNPAINAAASRSVKQLLSQLGLG